MYFCTIEECLGTLITNKVYCLCFYLHGVAQKHSHNSRSCPSIVQHLYRVYQKSGGTELYFLELADKAVTVYIPLYTVQKNQFVEENFICLHRTKEGLQ